MEYEHAVSTPRCLWLIYQIFHIFPLHQQKKLAEILFEDKFNELFFNWSWNVRNMYSKLYLYQLYQVYGQGMDREEEKEKKMRPKRARSNTNSRIIKMGLLDKNISGNATTSILKLENDVIEEIVKLAKNIGQQLKELIKEYKEEGEIDVNYYIRTYQSMEEEDSESENKSLNLQNDKIASILSKIPEKYLPYVNKSIEEFLVEQSTYLRWANEDTEDNILPEVMLQVILDESENPNLGNEGNDGW